MPVREAEVSTGGLCDYGRCADDLPRPRNAPVPLTTHKAVLAIYPSGRMWGLDGRLAARFGDRWPF